MDNKYPSSWVRALHGRAVGLLLLVLALATTAAQAQSGAYGNEWIVQGQPYYKIKIWRDGLYRLDQAYLARLGAGGVAPTQLQVWRRGKEVAVYQGGNSATLDNSTFLEFYGQRNDGALDAEFYKNRLDQANPYYSFYTDTAAYFVTWGSRAGKRMAQPVVAGGPLHGWRIQSSLVLKVVNYAETNPSGDNIFLPWLEKGEGFFRGWYYFQTHAPLDSALRAVATTPGVPAPTLEALVAGGFSSAHRTNIQVIPPTAGAVARTLGAVAYNGFDYGHGRYPFLLSDISSTGQVEVSFDLAPQPPQRFVDVYRQSWWRVTAPQQNVWFTNRRQVFFQNDSLLSGPATYEVDNVPATVRGFDIEDPWNVQRVEPAAATTLGSTGRRYVFASATSQQARHLLLADEAQGAVPLPARRVTFRNIDPAKPNFIVITHPKLMQAAGTVPNVARAYTNYRASAAGGTYDTLMVTAPQLYDQFHYGERSLMALRHFALWLAAKSPATQSKYLLLLGKGIVPGAQVTATPVPDQAPDRRDGANAGYTARVLGENGLDLIPVSTRSPSDIFLSSDWPHDNFTPALATGRVVATTPQEALVYLTKLQEYEAQINPNQLNPESWHKNIQHISGGHEITEIPAFRAHLDAYKRLAERPLFGGKVATTQRAYTGDALPVTVYIPNELNAGLALITYFGHGSTTEFDLNLGNINDITTGYNNAKKYPVMMYNGCSAGNAFTNSPTFATDWIFAANKGSIGMMAESGLSYEYLLNPSQDLTYRLLFNDPQWFGRPIAEVRREVVRRLVPSFAGNPQGTEQLLCTIWQGDPALRMYAPAKPDLVVSNATLSLSPIAPDAAISAASTQFTLNIGVSNPLRITRDSVEIRVTRSFPAPRPSIAYVFNNHLNNLGQLQKPFPQAFQRDTTYTIVIPNPSTLDVSGDNKFTVELDYRNKIAELDETNNTATLNYSFLKRGITLLTPTEFAIIPSNRPRLTAQSNDASGPVRSYDFQVDSVATFDSPGGLQAQTISAGVIASWTPPRALLAKRDSAVWYWRVRFTNPVGTEDAGWQVSSFRVIPTALSGGWSQSHNGQFNRDQLAGVAVAAPSNRWSFTAQNQALTLRTAGGGAPGSPFTFGVGGYGIATGSTVPDISTCAVRVPNLVLAVFDQYSLQRIVVPGTYSTCGQPGQAFYHFANDANGADTLDNLNNSAARRAQLLDFLSKVPDGSYVALVSANRLRFADPNVAATMRQVATLLGSKVVANLKNGEPWALVAQKKATGGLALAETGPDRNQPSPTSQTIVLTYALATPGQAGTITSTLIGPAQQWRTLFDVIRPETPTASYRLALVGYDASNQPTVLNPDIKTKNLDMSAYSATTYPYMQLQLALRDSVNRRPPQLKQWLLTYKGLPEGVVRRDLVATTKYDSTSLKNQAVNNGFLNFPVKFDNISQEAFTGRLPVLVQLISVSTGLAVKTTTLTAPRELPANDSVLTVNVRLDVTGTFGKFFVRVMVNPQGQPLGQPQGQPEQYFFNNELRTDAFTVRDNNVPPTLDVAVDGRHILDGEIVSPSPVIAIQLRDEDRLRLIKDASYFTVFLQKNNEAPVPVDVNGAQMRFTVDNTAGSLARLEYQPGLNKLLDDGIYTLRVQGRDASNTSAGTQDYQVKFEVIQASKISNVYPYPNPVTSKAKFVFTVTGQELPRNMKIQIMTLTGRVVREIFMNELGPLHIGNNITDYAWDGTDQYGDRLANGTYLYRVAIDDPTGAYKKYTTAGDQAFKNDWGKLVLLR